MMMQDTGMPFIAQVTGDGATTTTLTLPVSMSATASGVIIVEGI
jgi:hypothetical protein